jgi:cytochrome c biogenesis protein CcmG/thiol:disulfide interchange protein DsbE
MSVRLSVLLLLAAGAAALAGACGHSSPPGPPPPSSQSRILGAPVPAFRRPSVQGGTFDTAEADGRVLVVDFFADYCRPCQRTLPRLEALHRAEPRLVVVGVSLDGDAAGAWKSIGRHHLSFPVVHDAGNVLAGRFRVTELPFAFVIDGSGRVRFAAGPDQPEDALGRAALATLGGS